jgi:TPR repeat protein
MLNPKRLLPALPLFASAPTCTAVLAAVAFLAAAPASARAVADVPDWARMVQDWTARADGGDKDAASHLCELYFDGRNGKYDPAQTVAWCARAADAGDAHAVQRLGLLALAGIGGPKNLDEAAKRCGEASAMAPDVGAGFCQAAISEERERQEGVIPDVGAAQPPSKATSDPAMGKLRDQAEHGDHAALGRLCSLSFEAPQATFDPARTVDWCRRAAGYGDADALRRLGMMRFWGVGMEKGSAQASAMCTEAQARDPSVSASFCLAAVKAERLQATEAAYPTRYAYPQPWAVADDLGLLPHALTPDRVLESVRTTDTGLQYSCRDLIKWARYGLALDGKVFGRPIADFNHQDYASLDKAATECISAIAPYDPDGSERSQLADFRKLLPSLEARQVQLAQEARQRQVEQQQQQRQTASQRRDFALVVAFLSPQQSRCVDAIRASWLAGGISPGAQSLEIRTVETSDASGSADGGNTVVNGTGRVIPDIYANRFAPLTYSCTFDGKSGTLTSKSVRTSVPVANSP